MQSFFLFFSLAVEDDGFDLECRVVDSVVDLVSLIWNVSPYLVLLFLLLLFLIPRNNQSANTDKFSFDSYKACDVFIISDHCLSLVSEFLNVFEIL